MAPAAGQLQPWAIRLDESLRTAVSIFGDWQRCLRSSGHHTNGKKWHKNQNGTKTKMARKSKWHENRNGTKTEMAQKPKRHRTNEYGAAVAVPTVAGFQEQQHFFGGMTRSVPRYWDGGSLLLHC